MSDELTQEAPPLREWVVKKAFVTGGMGVGAAVAWALLSAIHSDPSLLRDCIAVLGGWGPMAVLLGIGIWFADRRMSEWMAENRRNHEASERFMSTNAAAQRDLANAVAHIAEKDDNNTRQSQTIMTHVGRQVEKLMEYQTVSGERQIEMLERLCRLPCETCSPRRTVVKRTENEVEMEEGTER